MRLIALLTAAIAVPVAVSAQSLAAVARKEEARRQSVKSGKVYTNASLKEDITPSAPPSTSGNTSPAAPDSTERTPDTPAAAGKDESAKDEKYWRSRITAAREALERSKIFADALQSRINALNTDFVNRDDPAQRSQIDLERQRALAELERVKKEIAGHEKAITDIGEEARRAGVPPGWLR